MWLVGVDPNIQITLEMIRDEQLGIIAALYFKHIIDFVFLLQWKRFTSGFLHLGSLLATMLHMQF